MCSRLLLLLLLGLLPLLELLLLLLRCSWTCQQLWVK
jgi:hypothetical protein